MDQYQTRDSDLPGECYFQVPWEYQLLKQHWKRFCVGVFFVVMHLFILVAPIISPRKATDGSLRRIPTTNFLAAVLPVYAFGALWGVFLVIFSPRMEYHTSTPDVFVKYSARRWEIDWPLVSSVFDSVC